MDVQESLHLKEHTLLRKQIVAEIRGNLGVIYAATQITQHELLNSSLLLQNIGIITCCKIYVAAYRIASGSLCQFL
jgi:hypothetical protein